MTLPFSVNSKNPCPQTHARPLHGTQSPPLFISSLPSSNSHLSYPSSFPFCAINVTVLYWPSSALPTRSTNGSLPLLHSSNQEVCTFFSSFSPLTLLSVWAATTKDQDYIKSEGLKRTVIDPAHRNEIVAGGMSDHLTHAYKEAMDAVADRAGDFFEAVTIHRMYGRLSISSFLSDPLHQLPQIVFTLRAVQHPASIPLSLASLTLITQTTQSFTLTLFSFFDGTGSIANKLSSIRKLYEVGNIPNQVLDGTLPFPEDQSSLLQGLSIQFIDVSFKYPGSESYALRHVSFKIEKGQLCVGALFQLVSIFHIVLGHRRCQRIRKKHHSQTRHKTIRPVRGHYPHRRIRHSHTQTLGSQTCHLCLVSGLYTFPIIGALSPPLYSIANTITD